MKRLDFNQPYCKSCGIGPAYFVQNGIEYFQDGRPVIEETGSPVVDPMPKFRQYEKVKEAFADLTEVPTESPEPVKCPNCTWTGVNKRALAAHTRWRHRPSKESDAEVSE